MTETGFDDINEEKQKKITANMLVRDAVVALAADPKSWQSIFLIKITDRRKRTWKMWRMVLVTLTRKG